MHSIRSLLPVCALFVFISLTLLCYWPGLSGGFLFDDYPNLKHLGSYGGIVDFDSLKSFISTGFAGPTGRPVALLSFLLDDNTWPSQAAYFKATNLKIHLLVGLLVCWASLLLLRLYQVSEQRAIWVALLSAGIWLLHPYLVSTTLYVVQRMAQLTTLFMLAGLVGYFYARRLLEQRPLTSYFWMAASLGLGTLLAVLSKENGALLPMLVLVIEFCRPKTVRPLALWWQAPVLWLPSLIVLGYLAKQINFSPDLWPHRPFDQPERLLTEPRILWEYLYNLVVPSIEGQGLYQDDYQISRGWFSPPATALAMFGLVALVGSAVFLRRRWPIFSVAVLFFLVSHLIESTVIGLELHFEHRNYAASVFLFLPVAYGVVCLANSFRLWVAILAGSVLILLLSAMTWQRASLWSNSDTLSSYWAAAAPNSARAQNELAAQLIETGQYQRAMDLIDKASERMPDSALLTLRSLLQKVYINRAEESDFRWAAERLRYQPFDAQAVVGLRRLVERVSQADQRPAYRDWTLDVIAAMETNDRYRSFPLFQRLAPYLRAQVLMAKKQPELAYNHYSRAMQLYQETDAALSMVAEMARSGYRPEALKLLDQAREVYKQQPVASLKRSTGTYDMEFERMENMIRSDIENTYNSD